jgi:hypothetical protein
MTEIAFPSRILDVSVRAAPLNFEEARHLNLIRQTPGTARPSLTARSQRQVWMLRPMMIGNGP